MIDLVARATVASMPPPVLRPYQRATIDLIRASWEAGKRAPLVQLATGSGKTVVAGAVIQDEVAAGRRVLFMAPRRELITQTSIEMAAVGIDHAICMAGHDHRADATAGVQVASVDTLHSRLRAGRHPFGPPDLIIVDEAHLYVTKARQALLDRWPDARRLGLTATPGRHDGRALGTIFDDLIAPVSIQQLIEDGYLVRGRYFSVGKPDLSRVSTRMGDYVIADLDRVMNTSTLVGDIVQTWLQRAGDRRTVVFATSISHSGALTQAFLKAGVAAEHVDAGTEQKTRDGIFERFRNGETQVLCNCFLASYGFNLPALSCVVLARPTKSLTLYLQMLGRGLRIADGKQDCLVLDHSGAVHEHGFAEEDRVWTLDGDHCLEAPEKRSSKKSTESSGIIECPECQLLYTGTNVCPECGYAIPKKVKPVETAPGELVELSPGKADPDDAKRKFYRELRSIANERNYKHTWPDVNFKEKYKHWPPFSWRSDPPETPSDATRRWVKSRMIAFSKKRARA